MGLPTQQPKFARIFFTVKPCETKAEEGEELKNHNPLELRKLERGETKRSYKDIQQRNNVRHGVSTVHLLHMPTEGPERQEVINKGQSAYRRTRASRSYQQRPECLLKDQSVKKLSTTARAPTKGPERQKKLSTRPECQTGSKQQKNRQDGNHTRIGRSYTMVVPMNISSHGEVGDLTVEVENRQEEGRTKPLIRTTRQYKKQTTRRHATKKLRHLMHDKH